jgi:hypothetical protein
LIVPGWASRQAGIDCEGKSCPLAVLFLTYQPPFRISGRQVVPVWITRKFSFFVLTCYIPGAEVWLDGAKYPLRELSHFESKGRKKTGLLSFPVS